MGVILNLLLFVSKLHHNSGHTGSTDLLYDGAPFMTALKVFAYIFIAATRRLYQQ